MSGRRTEHVPGSPRIAYDIEGSGGGPSGGEGEGERPTVVFLHGIGGNRTNWHDQLPAVANAGFTAVSWDARGYGDSDDYDGPLDFADFSRDLVRLLDHLGATRAHLVGLSMGGRILQDFYPDNHARVASLVLCCTFPGFDESFTPEKRAEFVRLRRDPLVAGKTPAEMAPAVAKSLIGPKASDAHYQRLIDSMSMLHVESYIKTVEATTYYDRRAVLPEIESPTLLVFASGDRLTPPAIGEKMLAEMPNARLIVIEDAGHLVNIERPEAFNEALLGFLREQE